MDGSEAYQLIDKHRERAILRAVELYYFEGLTQAAVSERLGCTRWTVGRLLQEADQQGIVRVTVHHPGARRRDLEIRLTEKYGLYRARVIPHENDPKATLKAVAVAAADFLTDIRPRPATIGLGHGRTVGAIVRAIPDTWDRGTTVAQMFAAPVLIDDALVGSSVRLLARRTGGEAKTLPATPVFATAEALAVARNENADCLESAAAAEAIVYSPGTVDAATFLLKDSAVTDEEAETALRCGAVAVVGNRVVNMDGEAAHADLDSRTLGITLDEMRAAPVSVAAGAGLEKVEAFKAVLGAALANTAVVDSAIAEELLVS